MLRNYLKITLRNLLKYKLYSIINIVGLAIGIACCALILLFVQDELGYDRFHEQGANIYRIAEKAISNGELAEEAASVPVPVALALRTDFPEVREVARFFSLNQQTPVVSYNEKKFLEQRFFLADSNVFRMFNFAFLKGDARTALNEPGTLVITEAMATKYFGTDEALGKTLLLNNRLPFKVTGILRDLPTNSHIQFDFLASMTGIDAIFREIGVGLVWSRSWYWNPCYTYILLPQSERSSDFEARLKPFVKKYFPPMLRDETVLYLQPLLDIHLHSHLFNELQPNGDILYVYVFAATGLFILVIACINFMNLATARSSGRAKEVGLRKVMGAQRQQLIIQFLGESFILCLIAVVLAVVLIEMFLPVFNALARKSLTTQYLDNWLMSFGLLGIVLFVGFFSGSYPAIFLSAFQPIESLRAAMSSKARRPLLRKALVVFQFSIAVCLIIGTGVVYNQLYYIHHKDLGFTKEQIVVIPIRGTPVKNQPETFKEELLKNPQVLAAAASSEVLGRLGATQVKPYLAQGLKPGDMLQWPGISADVDFLKTYGIHVVEGRGFSRDFLSDSSGYILNESAVAHLGWKEPLGKKFSMARQGASEPMGSVIGVTTDFHYLPLHKRIEPTAINIAPNIFDYLSIRISPDDIPGTIRFIESTWAQFVPDRPSDFFFLDDAFDKTYRSEAILGKLSSYFSVLAIVIACLGLFGLASFTTEQRTKEIGIRKVLGASLPSILLLVSKDFSKLVFFANLIAWPVSYFMMNRWLQEFAYRAEMSVWLFAAAGVLSLLIAFVTTSVQAMKTAGLNPVTTLRYE